MVTALRSFFRYLRHRDEIDIDLTGCVPCVSAYSLSTIPRFLPPGAVEKVLRRTDRSTPEGRRDYAVLMLLARLGLRTCEIVRMELEDVDGEVGQITQAVETNPHIRRVFLMRRDHDVFRLQIAMSDAGAVSGGEGVGNLSRDVDCFPLNQPPAGQHHPQGRFFDQLRCYIENAVIKTGIVFAQDSGMIQ